MPTSTQNEIAELVERLRYNLVTELSGRKEFAGWSINEIGDFADEVMKGVKAA